MKYSSNFNFDWLPDHIRKEVGRFNVFKLDEYAKQRYKAVPYGRKEYYKISLIIGKNKINYADRIFEVKKQAVLFTNPQTPYNWENLDDEQSGYICVFSSDFFYQFENLNDYNVFQPDSFPVFDLSEDEKNYIQQIFEHMFKEINSTYFHKYDVIRNLIFQIVHYILKKQHFDTSGDVQSRLSSRKVVSFLELLERQFPIEDVRQRLQLRTPVDFARKLAVHVNHLNKEIKATTGKTTSQVIAERILQEAKILLKHTQWTVSEIAFALGYAEVTNFNNSFKKQTNLNPTQFRQI